MATPPDAIRSAANAIAQLRPGDHLCHLYASEDEHRAVLTPFLQQGLERGERVLYVADFHTPAEILKYLGDAGLNVDVYQARDQLRLLSPAEAYVRDGAFEPLRMIALLEHETDQARHDGFTALRVTGEMTWALRGLPGSDRLIEYEITLDRFFETHPALAICQYDRRRFSPAMLLRVIEVHPLVIVGAEVYKNFYFVPSDDLMRPDRAERQLMRWLDTLADRRQLEVELWRQRGHLEQEVLNRTRELQEANQHLQREVEQHRQTEVALRAEQGFSSSLTKAMKDGFSVLDMNGVHVDVNPALCQMTGFAREELIGTGTPHPYWPPEEYDTIERAFRQTVRGEAVNLELNFMRKDGARFPALISPSFLTDRQGQVIGYMATVKDITERKQAERTLQARLRLAQYAVDHSLHELLVATLDEADQLTGSPIGFYHFLDADQHTLTLQAWSTRTTAEFCTAEGEGRHYSIDQAGVWVDCVRERRPVIHNDYAALPASQRKGLPPGHASVQRELVVPVMRGDLIVAILGVGNKLQPYDERDIATISLLADLAWEVAERKLADAARHESEEQYHNLFQNASVGIFHSLPEGRFLRVNPALAAMLHYASPEELVSTVTNIRTQLYIDSNKHTSILGTTLEREGWVYAENRYRCKDGSVLIGNLAVRKVLQADGTLAYLEGFVEDITERKRSADAERDQRALAEALRETATVLNSTLNLDEVLDRILSSIGRVVPHEAVSLMLLNDEQTMVHVARYHGYAMPGTETVVHSLQFELAQTRNLRTLFETRRPLVIADVHEYPEWLVAPGRDWIRSYAGVPICSRRGVVGFLNLYSATPGFYARAQAERLQAFADQAAIAVENAQLHARIQAHVDELEQRVAERTGELTAANVRLTELDRLKDEFLTRISHELRTPLTSIRLYLDLLENGKPEKREKYLRTLNEQSERLQGLIERLLDVSRLDVAKDDIQLRPLNFNHVANELINDSQATAVRHGLTLILEAAADLPVVQADAVLLPQALSPIMGNALAYTPAGGTITVTTAVQTNAAAQWGTLTVRDTGPGIEPAEIDLIFDRFYRGSATRDYKTPGTGLGLSISRSLIEKCGGRITVESVPGQGAAFTIWLPLT